MILYVNFHFTEKFVFTIENGNVKYFTLANGHGWQVTLIPSLIIEQFSQDLFRLALVDRKPLLSGVVMYMFDCLFI